MNGIPGPGGQRETQAGWAMIMRKGVFDVDVCVPAYWDDATVIAFTEREFMCGTASGWKIRREPPVRVPCASRDGFVHVVLVA